MASKYLVKFFVNKELTCVLENVPSASEAYSLAVPGEASLPHPGNRWHLMIRFPAVQRLQDLESGEVLKVAWQDYPLTEGLDTEEIYIAKM